MIMEFNDSSGKKRSLLSMLRPPSILEFSSIEGGLSISYYYSFTL